MLGSIMKKKLFTILALSLLTAFIFAQTDFSAVEERAPELLLQKA